MGKYLFRAGAVEDSCVAYEYLSDHLHKTGEVPLWATDVEGPKQDLCLDNKVAQRTWPV